MTDILSNPAVVRPLQRRIDVSSESAVRRVKRRYGAGRRFRAYGVGAICFAALFLVVLLTDIVLKAIPAFTQTRLTLDMPVSAEHVSADKVAAGEIIGLVEVMKSFNEVKADIAGKIVKWRSTIAAPRWIAVLAATNPSRATSV